MALLVSFAKTNKQTIGCIVVLQMRLFSICRPISIILHAKSLCKFGRYSKWLTIHLICFQIPEYCRVLEESEISEHCFDLIFAFDEIVALGYRENVNLAQIRTFTEMDSHEEKVFRAVREVRSSWEILFWSM